MNQHDQMREAFRLLQEIHPGNMTPMAEESWKAATVLVEQALAAEPASLVRLNDDSLISIYLTCKAEWKATNKRQRQRIAVMFGNAIIDAMERVNK